MTRLTGEALRRQAARQKVNALVRRGDIPHPRDSFCFDCRGEAAQYDHHRGYEGDAALDVQPVCVPCHAKRSAARGEVRGAGRTFARGVVLEAEPGLNLRIRLAREAAGLSIEEAAARRGVRSAAWESYEGCRGRSSRWLVQRVAEALGCPFEQLWGRPHTWTRDWRLVPVEGAA